MSRSVYVPRENVEDFATFASLTPAQIRALEEIVRGAEGRAIFDIYVDIMNRLGVGDEDAESIFDVYRYLRFVHSDRGVPSARVIDEIAQTLVESSVADGKRIADEFKKNAPIVGQLIDAHSEESPTLKAEALPSGFHNAVIEIRSLCDVRPIFDSSRSSIVAGRVAIQLAVTVTDSLGTKTVIPLNFNRQAFEHLRQQVELAERKIELIKAEFGLEEV